MTEKRQRKFPNLRAGRGDEAMTERKSVKYPSSRTAGLKRGGSPGRPKGVPNRATREAKELAAYIYDDPEVQERMLYDARRGRLAPPIATMLMSYRWGKPKETIDLKVTERLVIEVTDAIGDADPTIERPHDDVEGTPV